MIKIYGAEDRSRKAAAHGSVPFLTANHIKDNFYISNARTFCKMKMKLKKPLDEG
jgi:hypothetical protein